MTPKERVIASFRALCDRTEGGVHAVADAIGASAESLLQVYNGYKLPSGEPRGIGPGIQKRLEENFPGWAAELERLGALLDRGLLTKDEFDAQKAKLLSQ